MAARLVRKAVSARKKDRGHRTGGRRGAESGRIDGGNPTASPRTIGGAVG